MSSTKSSPRDFSIFSLFTAGLACLVPFASAYTKPVGAEPKGNPISEPGLNDVVPAGEPFAVTWQPTTQGTVTLLLLKGPSTDAVPQYAIAEKVPNTGTFLWVPSKELKPQDTGYGIQLICDSNGQYQYTTQFGISNPAYNPHKSQQSSSSQSALGTSSSASSSYQAYTTGYSTGTAPWSQSSYPSHNSTVIKPTGKPTVKPTGWMPHNTTMAKPTGSMIVPTSLKTTATPITSSYAATPTTPAPSAAPTGGAATVATSFLSLVFAAGVALFTL